MGEFDSSIWPKVFEQECAYCIALCVPLMEEQASRIIVYVLKNTRLTINEFVNSYNGSDEYEHIRKMIMRKYKQIGQIHGKMIENKKKNRHLTVENGNDEQSEIQLLQFQLSNNSIVSVSNDSDEQKSESCSF